MVKTFGPVMNEQTLKIEESLSREIQTKIALEEEFDSLAETMWDNAQELKQLRVAYRLGDITEDVLKKAEAKRIADVKRESEIREQLRVSSEVIMQFRQRMNEINAGKKKAVKQAILDKLNVKKTMQKLNDAAVDAIALQYGLHGMVPLDIRKTLGQLIVEGVIRVPGYQIPSEQDFKKAVMQRIKEFENGL
jgi:hypothetical protein